MIVREILMSSLLFLPFGLSDEVMQVFGLSLVAVVTVADWFFPDVEAAQSAFKPMTGLACSVYRLASAGCL